MADHDEAGEAYQMGGDNHFQGRGLGRHSAEAIEKLRRTAGKIVDEMYAESGRLERQFRSEISKTEPGRPTNYNPATLAAMQDVREGIRKATER